VNDGGEVAQRDEDAGVTNDIVIQEIARAGMEVVDVQRPTAQGNCKANIMLDIALTLQRNESIRF
jgi:hypothetical protein